jgi:cobalt-zinc-cadmium efflux system outer membrane protein
MPRRSLPASAAIMAACWFVQPGAARAQNQLTLEQALAVAREKAPAVQAARLEIEEARGRVTTARPLFATNPALGGAVGKRFAGGAGPDLGLEARVELSQSLELGGQRAARLAGARAALDGGVATAEAVLRETEAAVAQAFYRALHAAERLKLATSVEDALRSSAEALDRRFRAGDVPALQLNVAKTAHARAAAQVRDARAREVAALADLRRLLGLDPAASLSVAGDLREQKRYELAELLTRAGDRPDARALLAQAREARAGEALGRAERWPGVGVGAIYERHEGADILLGALTLELPLFQTGAGLRQTADARARRLGLAAEASRRSAIGAVQAAYAVHQHRLAAVSTLAEVLPLVTDNLDLARKSYESGQIALTEWLLVRREALEAMSAYTDELLEAAEAGIAVALAAGVSP